LSARRRFIPAVSSATRTLALRKRLGAGRCPIGELISAEPARTAALDEAFLAGCFAKAEEAEIHDHHDLRTGVLAASLAKRVLGYTSLGFPDPRRSPYAPNSGKTAEISQSAQWLSQRWQNPGRGGLKPNRCSTTSDSLTAAARTPLSTVTGR
jgi:hypothetical protein